MELWIIPCALLFVFIVVYLCRKKKLKEFKEQYNYFKVAVEEIKREKQATENTIDKLQRERNQLREQNEYINLQIIQQQERLSEIIAKGNQSARAAVEAFAEEYKKNQINMVNNYIQQLQMERLNMETQLRSELQPLIKEVEDYRAKRDAIIEAQKREIELRDQLEYHKIQLSEIVVEDIKYIQSILDRLSKPDVVAKVVWETYIQKPTKEMLNRIIGKEKKTGIYRITDINTQECYIGQGTDVAKRLTEHIKGTLGIQSIADQRIHHAMAEKGLQNWTFELIEECAKEDLNNREKFYISYYRSNEFGYNRTIGG